MYVVKIKHEDTLRRIVLDECFTYEALWKLVSERFELPATFCGVLRYEDCDSDLISVSTDEEVEEALRLCGDGKTLKMTLTAVQGSSAPAPALAAPQDDAAVGKAWAVALSDACEEKDAAAPIAADVTAPSSHGSVSSASGDFEMVDESDSRPASVRSSAAASAAAPEDEAVISPASADEEDEALQAALKASADQAAIDEEARVKASADQAALEEDARVRAVQEEEERLTAALLAAEAAEEEGKRVAALLAAQASEEEDKRMAVEQESRRIAEVERVRIAELAEQVAREEEAARIAEEVAAVAKAAEEETARIVAAKETQEWAELIAREELAAQAAEAEEKLARLEIAFAAAEEDALRRADELFNMGCSVDQIRSLYGESILEQLRLVPRLSDANSDEEIPDLELMYEMPAPVVNWEEAKAVAEQPEDERFPSQEQAAVVDEVGDLAARLTAFYFEHNAAMIDTVGDVSRKFVGKEVELNDALRRKYKCDLTTMVAQQAAAVAEQADTDAAAARRMVEEEEEFADAQSEPSEEEEPLSDEMREAIGNMEAMGFTDRATNLELLKKHKNNVEAALNELLA